MSYAGPTSRTSREPRIEPATGDSGRLKPSADRQQAWPTPASGSQARQTAIFAAGVVVGLAVGAGVALLFAPESGAYTRRALVRRGRRVTMRGRNAWDDLRDELRAAVRNRKRAWRRRRAERQEAAAGE
jgi:hypothetical protein